MSEDVNSNDPAAPSTSPRIGVVGCGLRAEWIVLKLLSEPCEIVFFVDPDPARIAHMKARFPALAGAATSETFADALRTASVDGVVIASPSARHAEHVELALLNDLPTYCEKPLAGNYADALRLTRLAGERGVAITTGYDHHSDPGFSTALDLVRKGAVGTVSLVQAESMQAWWNCAVSTWRATEPEPIGGMTGDTGSHLLEFTLSVIDATPCAVIADMTRTGSGLEVTSQLALRFPDGPRAYLTFIGTRPGAGWEVEERLRIIGSEAEVVATSRTVQMITPERGREDLDVMPAAPLPVWWLASIVDPSRPAPRSRPADVLAVLEAAHHSDRRRTEVACPLPPEPAGDGEIRAPRVGAVAIA